MAEACSGVNYLMSSMVVGYWYAGTTYRYWRHRVGFVVASALMPLVANGVRVYLTILISHFGGADSVAGTRHYLFGWLIFAAMVGLLVATCGNWREEPQGETPVPHESRPGVTPIRTWSPALFAALGLLLVGLAPLATTLYWQPTLHAWTPPQSPEIARPWEIASRDAFRWTPRFVSPSAEFARTYESGNRLVKVYVAYFSTDQRGVKLASAGNVLFEPPWLVAAEGRVAATVDGRSFQVRETALRSPQSSLLVWSWYWVNGTSTGNDYLAKILSGMARLRRSPDGSAAIAVATEDRLGGDAAMVLADFLRHSVLTGRADGSRAGSDRTGTMTQQAGSSQ